ncbi:unnamed protein product, partial [Iphiclides podalirius]
MLTRLPVPSLKRSVLDPQNIWHAKGAALARRRGASFVHSEAIFSGGARNAVRPALTYHNTTVTVSAHAQPAPARVLPRKLRAIPESFNNGGRSNAQ